MKQQIYIATAYRYGWTNHGGYIVAADTDAQAVIDAAYRENVTSGHKYAVAVTREPDGEMVQYLPSAWGEAKPTHNLKTETYERVGSQVLDGIEEGKECPTWIHEAIAREKQIVDIMHGATP